MGKCYRLRILAVLFISITLGGLASAEDAPRKAAKAPRDSSTLNYVTARSVDYVKLLPAPPKPDTEEAKADLEVVLRVQERRTDAQVQRALAEAKLKMDAFRPVRGAWFTAENLPLTAKLLGNSEKESKFISAAAKQ